MDFFIEVTGSIDKTTLLALAGGFVVIGVIIWRFPYSGAMAEVKQMNKITVSTLKRAGSKIEDKRAHRLEEIAERRMPVYGKVFVGVGLIIGVIASVYL